MVSPDSKALEESAAAFADLVGIYPDNPSYLLKYAEVLLQLNRQSTATEILRKLHNIYTEKGEARKAADLVERYPQIGRITAEEQQDNNSAIYDMVEKSVANKLWARVNQQSLREGQHLYHHGEHGDSLTLILKGELAIYFPDHENGLTLLNIVGEKDIVGEAAFLSPGKRIADVVANKDSVVLEIPRKRLLAYMLEHPEIQKSLENISERRRINATLSLSPLIRSVPMNMRQFIARQTEIEHFPANTHVHKAGAQLEAVEMLIDGRACYAMKNSAGKLQNIMELEQGELIGDTSAVIKASCPADLFTLSDITMAKIPFTAFKNVVEGHPPLREALLRHAVEQRGRLMRKISQIGAKPKPE